MIMGERVIMPVFCGGIALGGTLPKTKKSPLKMAEISSSNVIDVQGLSL